MSGVNVKCFDKENLVALIFDNAKGYEETAEVLRKSKIEHIPFRIMLKDEYMRDMRRAGLVGIAIGVVGTIGYSIWMNKKQNKEQTEQNE